MVDVQVQIQRRKTTQFGRANQRWFYEQSTGMIRAFSTDEEDQGSYVTCTTSKLILFQCVFVLSRW